MSASEPRRLRLLRLFWDRAAAVGCLVIAAVMLIVGWVSVSARSDAGKQLPYIMSSGIGGLFLASVGATLWLSADLRDEWRKLDVIDERLRRMARSDNGSGPSPDWPPGEELSLAGPRPDELALSARTERAEP